MRFVLGGRHGLAPDAGRSSDSHALCTCGHERETHDHLRRGTDCGSCGRDTCRAFVHAHRTNVVPLTEPDGQPAAVSMKAG